VQGIETTCSQCGLVQPDSGASCIVDHDFQLRDSNEILPNTEEFSKGVKDVIYMFHDFFDTIPLDILFRVAFEHKEYLKNLHLMSKKIEVFAVLMSSIIDRRPDEILGIVLNTTVIPNYQWVYEELDLPVDLNKSIKSAKAHLVNMMISVMKCYKEDCTDMKKFVNERSLMSKNCFKLFEMIEAKCPQYIARTKAKPLCLAVCYMASRNIKLKIKSVAFTYTGHVNTQNLLNMEKNIVRLLNLKVK
jgi:hypothetical protein